jgi:hypothetical protein
MQTLRGLGTKFQGQELRVEVALALKHVLYGTYIPTCPTRPLYLRHISLGPSPPPFQSPSWLYLHFLINA